MGVGVAHHHAAQAGATGSGYGPTHGNSLGHREADVVDRHKNTPSEAIVEDQGSHLQAVQDSNGDPFAVIALQRVANLGCDIGDCRACLQNPCHLPAP